MGGCQSKKVEDPIINESTKSYSDWKKERGSVPPAADAEDIDRSARHSKKYDLEVTKGLKPERNMTILCIS